MSEKRTRSFCFTINNWTDEDALAVFAYYYFDIADYLLVGYEVGEEGTPHLQCYVHFKEAKTFTSVRKWLKRAHVTPCDGTPEQNYVYCTKGKDYEELGVLPKNGVNKTDQNVIQAIENGKSMKDLYKMFPSYMLYHANKVRTYYDYYHENFATTELPKTVCYVIDGFHNQTTDLDTTVLHSIRDYFVEHEGYDKDTFLSNDVTICPAIDHLAAYNPSENDVLIIYDTDFARVFNGPTVISAFSGAAYGIPVVYKYGFEIRKLYAPYIVVVTSRQTVGNYTRVGYKDISPDGELYV